MRLLARSPDDDGHQIGSFSKWLLSIGDGLIGSNITDEQFEVEMPNDILIPKSNDNIMSIAYAIYGNIKEKFREDNYFRDRAIIAPTLEDVQEVNDFLINLLPGDDSICVVI